MFCHQNRTVTLASRSLALLLSALMIGNLAGCGNSAKRAEQRDELRVQTKTQVETYLEVARKNAGKAKAELPVVMESIAARASTYGEPYKALLAAAEQSLKNLDSASSLAQVESALEPLETAVSQL